MKFSTTSGPAAKKLRQRLNINQHDFWARIGVTQSGGSRYESGRDIPKPTARLLTIAYGNERESARAVKDLRKAVAGVARS